LVPALDIRIRGLDGQLQPGTPAIIDSGADISTLKADFCEALEVPLLGRRDFFVKYKVCFNERRSTFTLEPYPEIPV
jgi:hypothetical protein